MGIKVLKGITLLGMINCLITIVAIIIEHFRKVD